ncbi:hypothetical protein Tco_0370200 [Tanacetum coccineum]
MIYEDITCPWKVHISKGKNEETWTVRTLKDDHDCLQTRTVNMLTNAFLIDDIEETIKPNPEVPTRALKDQLQKKYQLGVIDNKIYRAKAKASMKVLGDFTEQYALLRDYVLELQRTNPDTTVKLDVEICFNPSEPIRQFRRIYICLGALKKGFKAGMRDLLGLDGCFMKGQYPGHTTKAVGGCDAKPWNIALKMLLWKLNIVSCRAHCDMLLNNICEVFNRQLVDGRDVPIITCLEFVREYLMKRIVKVQQVIDKSKGPLTPTAVALFKAITDEVSFYKIGRPPKKRKKSADELSSQKMTSGGKLSRIGMTRTWSQPSQMSAATPTASQASAARGPQRFAATSLSSQRSAANQSASQMRFATSPRSSQRSTATPRASQVSAANAKG